MATPRTDTRAAGVRARAKEAMDAEILAAAREQLAAGGPWGLNVRSVAREVGLVSSAVYRYYPSRDALLTALIVESYDALGDAVDAALASVPHDAFALRYRTLARAVREWAVAEPAQWLLVFGSPIPGYEAPQDTVGPATRISLAMARLLEEATRAGAVAPGAEVLADVHDALELREAVGGDVPDEVLVRGLVAWTYVLGAVSTEILGHRHRVVDPSGARARLRARARRHRRPRGARRPRGRLLGRRGARRSLTPAPERGADRARGRRGRGRHRPRGRVPAGPAAWAGGLRRSTTQFPSAADALH